VLFYRIFENNVSLADVRFLPRRSIKKASQSLCSDVVLSGSEGVLIRTTGYRQIIEVHLLFPRVTSVSEAHALATALEERLPVALGMPAEVITHLESLEDHAKVEHWQHSTGKPD
jgi:divalent metal cation (Fe/Co/Zn/Cd) transporter